MSAIKKKIRQKIDAIRSQVGLRWRCLQLAWKCRRQPGLWDKFARERDKNPPIFIIGCGHSGTSFLLAVLGSHSRLCPIPEESKLAYSYVTDTPRFHDDAPRMIQYFDFLAASQGKARWIEKTPKHIYSVVHLRERFPGCKFLLILRDGRDVVCSMERRWPNSTEYAIQRWVDDNTAGEKFWRDPDTHVLKYEDMIADLEGTMRQALAFLGENFEDAVLRSHEQPKYFYSKKIAKPADETVFNHDQFRNWQINQKMFDSRGQWKKLSEDKKAIIKRIGGRMLIKYGYATDLDW